MHSKVWQFGLVWLMAKPSAVIGSSSKNVQQPCHICHNAFEETHTDTGSVTNMHKNKCIDDSTDRLKKDNTTI